MSYKTYESYKDSNVEWIGGIPFNWQLVRNKNLFIKTKVIVGQQWENFPVLSLTKKGVIFKDIELNEGKMPSDFSIVKIGSLTMLVTDYVANGSFASLKQNVKLYQEPNYAYFVRNTDLKSNSFGVYVDQHSYDFLS